MDHFRAKPSQPLPETVRAEEAAVDEYQLADCCLRPMIDSLPTIYWEALVKAELENMYQKLLRLANRFITLSGKIAGTTGSPTPKRSDSKGESDPVDLAEIVSDSLLDLQPEVNESGSVVEQDLEGCPTIHFSRKNLKRVIFDLLSNAIKYRAGMLSEPLILLLAAPPGRRLLGAPGAG